MIFLDLAQLLMMSDEDGHDVFHSAALYMSAPNLYKFLRSLGEKGLLHDSVFERNKSLMSVCPTALRVQIVAYHHRLSQTANSSYALSWGKVVLLTFLPTRQQEEFEKFTQKMTSMFDVEVKKFGNSSPAAVKKRMTETNGDRSALIVLLQQTSAIQTQEVLQWMCDGNVDSAPKVR